MKNTTEVLKALRDFFNNPDIEEPEKVRAWQILTALRGPDLPSHIQDDVKRATTCVIREAAFGRGNWLAHICDIHYDSQESVELRRAMPPVGAHFMHHVQEAFLVLGLDWASLNEPKK